MSTEYLDWTSLESGFEAASEIKSVMEDVSVSETTPDARLLSDLLDMDEVPDELKQLVNRQKQLEQQLDELTGSTVSDDWNDQRFPMPQHTAASRLADKQKVRREEEFRSGARQQATQRRLSRLQLERGMKEAELARHEKLRHKKCQALQMQQRINLLELEKRRALRHQAQVRLNEIKRQLIINEQRQQLLLKRALNRRQALKKSNQHDLSKRLRLEAARLAQRQAEQRWVSQRDSLLSVKAEARSKGDMAVDIQRRTEVLREKRLAIMLEERQAARMTERRKAAEQEKKKYFS